VIVGRGRIVRREEAAHATPLVGKEARRGGALDLQPPLIGSLAAEALAETRGARPARIECHPRDASALEGELSARGLGASEGLAAEIAPDPALARGSIRVHTDLGTLDACLHTRLERLAAALRDVLAAV
jgi:flagellar biosynthesis/type III secretory pathway protein FliH